MKNLNWCLYAIMVAAMLFLTACGKEQAVYVAGYEDDGNTKVAKLWKNGEPQHLKHVGNDSGASSVYVTDKYVFVAGGSANGPMLWQNGEPQALESNTSNSLPSSVFVSGKDIYVAGIEEVGGKPLAILWKNGEPQHLSSRSDFVIVSSVFVSGKDVYVAGTEMVGANRRDMMPVALLWKNGASQRLEDRNGSTGAHSVFVSGKDIYVAGFYKKSQRDNSAAALWKNGEMQLLTDEKFEGNAQSVFVFGKDVYVAGTEKNQQRNDVAMLWKNGQPQRLTDGKFDAEASSVYVSRKDVYVAGTERNQQRKTVAMLWKNGEPQRLTDGSRDAEAHSVYVGKSIGSDKATSLSGARKTQEKTDAEIIQKFKRAGASDDEIEKIRQGFEDMREMLASNEIDEEFKQEAKQEYEQLINMSDKEMLDHLYTERDRRAVANANNILASFISVLDIAISDGRWSGDSSHQEFQKIIDEWCIDEEAIPELKFAKNPWNPDQKGYNTTLVRETSIREGAMTASAATKSNKGQVQLGYYNGPEDSVIVVAVFLDKVIYGSRGNVFIKIQGL
ncbi:MAG: hypothetical protein FWG12_00275 [Holophagaceae bacterium]|nr:hypothetical protein [Holophagaceae bacterium]